MQVAAQLLNQAQVAAHLLAVQPKVKAAMLNTASRPEGAEGTSVCPSRPEGAEAPSPGHRPGF